MPTAKERLDKHDRSIETLKKLMEQGMRMIVQQQQETRLLTGEIRKDHAEIRKELKELAVGQKRTDATLRDFMASMRRGGNGHEKGFAL